jgi:hypothetical protein
MDISVRSLVVLGARRFRDGSVLLLSEHRDSSGAELEWLGELERIERIGQRE